jgi:SAM-dependent methyltransferase
VLDIWSAVGFRTVVAGVRLGVFDALAGGPLSAEELSQRINADPRGTTMLLRALDGLGYVSQDNGRYSNAPIAARWLTADGRVDFSSGFEYWGTIFFELMDDVEGSVRGGEPPVDFYPWVEERPAVSHSFQEWMVALAQFSGGEIVDKIELAPGPRRLLDVGGGHATYSIMLCRRYPELTATVFDLPEALATGRQNVAAAQLDDRITFVEGRFGHDDLGSGYDVAFLFNVIHGCSPDENADLIKRASRGLTPGGQLVVGDQLAGDVTGSSARAITGLLGLVYYHLIGGQVFEFEGVAGWMEGAGLQNIRRVDLRQTPGHSLVFGVAPA